jgi:hypothetical protein
MEVLRDGGVEVSSRDEVQDLTLAVGERREDRRGRTRGHEVGENPLRDSQAGDGLSPADRPHSAYAIAAFRTAGSILLFLLALDMIFASPAGLRPRTIREQEEISYEHDVSVFPLAIPLIAGPGTIMTVLLYTSGRDLASIAVFVAVLLAVMLSTLAALLLAPRIMRLFGETGSNVLTRVLGVLLAALAVQFVFDGIESSLG